MPISRHTLRYVHFACTAALGTFVYSSALRDAAWLASFVQFGVFPVAALTGLMMWLGHRFGRRLPRTFAAPSKGGRP